MSTNGDAPDIGAALARACNLGAAMTDATERLNKSITDIEAELAGLQLGVTASVEMESEVVDDGRRTVDRYLRFGKVDREWKLMVDAGVSGDLENWDSTPVLDMSREIRLEVVEHLPALVQALIDKAAGEVEAVRRKAAEVESLATVVRASRGGPK